jgi:hypothetical protein
MSRTREVQSPWEKARRVKRILVIFFDIKEIVHKEWPGRPNSEFHILLWHFTATVWKCTKTSLRTLATTLLISFSPIEDKTEGLPFWHNWGGRDRIPGGDKHTHRTRPPGCILTISERPETAYTRGRGLLRGWWWPVGRKLVFDHITAPFPEIIALTRWQKLWMALCKPQGPSCSTPVRFFPQCRQVTARQWTKWRHTVLMFLLLFLLGWSKDSCILCKQKARCRVDNTSIIISFLNKFSPVYILPFYFFKDRYNGTRPSSSLKLDNMW